MRTFQLHNGVNIPAIGLGTYRIIDENAGKNALKFALQNGYRHIDTAVNYANEHIVGKAIKESGIPREELFITTKVWNNKRNYTDALDSFYGSLSRLDVDYIDLLLIHWPANEHQFGNEAYNINYDTWRAFEKLYKEGKVKAIGVSNFLKHHLEDLLNRSTVVPMVNQIEYHPGFTQQETVDFCRANNIVVEAWSPLGRGRVLTDSLLVELSHKYQVSTSDICLQFAIQQGIVVLPKSATEERILSNLNFDFNLEQADIDRINQMPQTGWSGLDPDTADF